MANQLDTREFIKRAKQKHGERYDYSKVKYVKGTVRITIGCYKHGDFQQKPTIHIHGNGCPKCGTRSKKH